MEGNNTAGDGPAACGRQGPSTECNLHRCIDGYKSRQLPQHIEAPQCLMLTFRCDLLCLLRVSKRRHLRRAQEAVE